MDNILNRCSIKPTVNFRQKWIKTGKPHYLPHLHFFEFVLKLFPILNILECPKVFLFVKPSAGKGNDRLHFYQSKYYLNVKL